ncbi:MAG TPA: glycoside hydrolase family 31 protein, partial [Planctomycetota bacterium]|nr:glycoside hydrolase family 31 protein [Planctomycetota bacterium]
YPLHWGGDNSPQWSNLVPQITGGLSFGLSGFQFWSQDIGGFLGHTGDAMLVRWMQIGMFISHCRIHGGGDREVYKFPPDVMRHCRDFIQLRYRLMPYVYGQAAKCLRLSLPMLRALVIDHQHDPSTWRIDDQWLFGDDLLVAPIFDVSDRRRAYLPAGRWVDWWTRAGVLGGRWIDVHAPIDRIPLWIREGAVVPLGPVLPYVDARPTTAIELVLAPFTGDGETVVQVPVHDHEFTVTYRAIAGRHVVDVGPTPVAVAVIAACGATVELRRG